MATHLDFIKDILSHLKIEYGNNADFYRIVGTTPNPGAGTESLIREKHSVTNVIRLPSSTKRIPLFSGFMKEGGSHDVETRDLLVDGSDLPSDYTPETGDYVVFDSTKYVIHIVERLDQGYGYKLEVKATEGEQLSQIIEEELTDYVGISTNIGGSVE